MAFHEYPYTNFHEMNLDWVIAQVKALTEAWAQVQTDWTNQQEAFDTLKSWIENYFANLNVQTEINNKIDELVLNGTMSELIAPYVASGLPAEVAAQIGDVVATQIGAVVAAQLPGVVSAQLPAIAAQAAADEVGSWLSTHIDPDTGYVIDDTLTVQGAAADAKAVGDAVTELKSALTQIRDKMLEKVYDIDKSNSYYADTTSPLSTSKIYALVYTVNTSGTYDLASGTGNSVGSMVDTIGTSVSMTANTPYTVYPYIPSQNDIYAFRISSNVIDWNIKIYELIDVSALKAKVDANDATLTIDDELLNHVAEKITHDNNIFDPTDEDIEEGGIYLSNGTWYQNADYFETGYIPCPRYSTIYFTAPSTMHVNTFKQNKERLTGLTSTTESATMQSVYSGNASYVRIGLPMTERQSAYVGFQSSHVVTYEYKIKESALPEEDENAWRGKKWYAFGTSLTDNVSINPNTGEVIGKYSDILAELSGMTLVNKGVSGGTFATTIRQMVSSTDVSDADLITIEGCVNDFAVGTPIGGYGDYTTDTLYGCMYSMAKYCSEHSNALVVFITDSTGKLYTPEGGTASDLRFFYKKGNGLTQGDYNEAIKKCSAYMGIPCIDAGGESSINFFHPDYLADQIHHTDLGGEQYARTIWRRLKELKPILVSDEP